jgi:RNA polymerase sigma-70 factor (ECF subfamily)
MDDEALLSQAAEGDTAAFELLVRRHADGLWRLARSVVRDDHIAEEAVQDTFVKAHRGLATYRREASVKTWLSRICYRAAIDRVRIKRLHVVPIDTAVAAHSAAVDVELRMALRAALDELPGDEREAFELVHVLGYSREEAAQIVGVPPSTLRSRAGRARQRLATALSSIEDSVAEELGP